MNASDEALALLHALAEIGTRAGQYGGDLVKLAFDLASFSNVARPTALQPPHSRGADQRDTRAINAA